MPLCIISGWNIKKEVRLYIMSILMLQGLLTLVFTARDIILFYICYEAVLIPMYFMIVLWGSRERRYRAGYLFFLVTLVGSILMLLSIIEVISQTGETSYEGIQVAIKETGLRNERWIWIGFFVGFAVKVPLVPVHMWLPEAHVEAPTPGSVILAGVLLKLGTYGYMRLMLPYFVESNEYYRPLVWTLCGVGMVVTSLTAMRQIDMKKIIAYSSIAHMGMVVIAIFTPNIYAMEGAVLLMISHGLVSGALFIAVGVVYDRLHTRILKYMSGLAMAMPVYSTILVILLLSNMGLPPTSGFISEMLIIIGIVKESWTTTILLSISMILVVAYNMWLGNRILFGNKREETEMEYELVWYKKLYAETEERDHPSFWDEKKVAKEKRELKVPDIDRRELSMLMPLIVGIIAMGVHPDPIIDLVNGTLMAWS